MRIFKHSLLVVTLLVVIALLTMCQRQAINVKVDREKGTMTVRVDNKRVSEILATLYDREGIKIVAPEFQDRNISLSVSNQPVGEVLEQMLGRDTRYWIVVERGELALPGILGEKSGRRVKSRSDLPHKELAKEITPETPVAPKGNIKVRPEEVKLLESQGEKETKTSPAMTKEIPAGEGPKIERKEAERPEDRYGRLRFRLEEGKIILERAMILPGKYVSELAQPDDYIYAVKLRGNVVAVGSFRDPLIRHTYFPEEEKAHELLRAKSGVFDITLPGELLLDKNLLELRVEISKMIGPPPTMELTPKTFPQFRKVLKELKFVHGRDLTGRFQDLTIEKKEDKQ